jgi:hypothetical protein
MFGVKLTRCFGVVFGVKLVPMGRMGVFGGSRNIVAFVMVSRLPVVMGCLFVMHGCLVVMIRDFIRMGHQLSPDHDANGLSAGVRVWVIDDHPANCG